MKKSNLSALNKAMKGGTRFVQFFGNMAAVSNGCFILTMPRAVYGELDKNIFPADPGGDAFFSAYSGRSWNLIPEGADHIHLFNVLHDSAAERRDTATVTRLLIENVSCDMGRVVYGGNDEVTIVLDNNLFMAVYPFTGARNAFCKISAGKKGAVILESNDRFYDEDNEMAKYKAMILPINYKVDNLKNDLKMAG